MRLEAFLHLPVRGELVARFPQINGEPGVIALRSGAVAAVLALTVREHLITRIYAVVDPHKLAQVRRVLENVTIP